MKQIISDIVKVTLVFLAFVVAPQSGLCKGSNSTFNKFFPAGTPIVRVATGLLPIKYIVDRVGGEYIDSVALLPPGSDPHTYEPKVAQLAVLNDADVYFSINTPFEEIWLPRFTAVSPNMKVVDITKPSSSRPALPDEKLKDDGDVAPAVEPVPPSGAVTHVANASVEHTFTPRSDSHAAPATAAHEQAQQVIPSSLGTEDSHVDEHGEHDEHDPHIWLSPTIVRAMAKNVCAELSLLLPEYKLYFEKNLLGLEADIDELDEDIKAEINQLPDDKKVFLVFHPSWGNFAEDYGLTQLSIEYEGKEPTPETLAVLMENAGIQGLSVIFVQKEFNPAMAQSVAQHLKNGKVVMLDPLAYDCLKSIKAAADAIVLAAKNT